jgi:hypothetical protein
MKVVLNRYKRGTNYTLGIMTIDNHFFAYTLEDAVRDAKIKDETAIPEGTYSICFREKDTRLTNVYRKKYDWFTYHLEIQGIPNYKYVYIHEGNNRSHTSGCILVGREANRRSISKSAEAFEDVYKMIGRALYKGHNVTIEIKDIYET